MWQYRLEEKKISMDIQYLRVLEPRSERFTVGAVAGSMLYLTSFQKPILGAILSVDLAQQFVKPEVRACFLC